MGNQRCVNGTLDTSSYSSPMPTIGLYITGSTLVCLLFILLDICAGFRNRKRWLPCHFFPLNSVTLTLLGVATKLPVDLTTSMPSAQDQFSKLTGTTFICICMGFLMPSLGLNSKSECLSNMTSLTVFVITVFVNVCIQMRTGVIISYKAEHIIILCCMMLMLIVLWSSSVDIQEEKGYFSRKLKYFCSEGHGSLMRRLQLCYLYGYNINPQLQLCRRSICCKTSGLCIVCAAILVEVIFRSFISKKLEFCEGISDYGWSTWAIVVSQTITILVGCLGATIRFLSMANHAPIQYSDYMRSIFYRLCGDASPSWLKNDFVKVILSPIEIIFDLITVLLKAGNNLVQLMKHLWKAQRTHGKVRFNKFTEARYIDYKSLMLENAVDIDDWTLRKGVKEMILTETEGPKAVVELLHRTPPPFQEPLKTLLTTLQQREVSPISAVVLAGIFTITIPSSPSRCIYESFEEVFDVMEYIARKTISPKDFNFYGWHEDLRGWWTGTGKGLRLLKAHKAFQSQNQLELDLAIETIKDVSQMILNMARFSKQIVKIRQSISTFHHAFPNEIEGVVGAVLDFIENKDYATIEDLYSDVEQIIVVLLKKALVPLPSIIFKEIIDSSVEDLERKVKHALKLIIKVGELESIVPWSFPVGTTITSLTTDHAAVVESRGSMTFEGTSGGEGHRQDEIIEME